MKYVTILRTSLSQHRGETSLINDRTKSYFWKSSTITIILDKSSPKSSLQKISFERNQKVSSAESYFFLFSVTLSRHYRVQKVVT